MLPLRDTNPTAHRPVVTIGLVAAIAAVFGFELFLEVTAGPEGVDELFRTFGATPAAISSAIDSGTLIGTTALTLLTYQFLHAGLLHAAGNLLYLWIFGNNVEERLGHLGYLIFYLWAGILAALTQVVIDPTSDVPLVGASGAISGVLGAYLVLYPKARVQSIVFLVFFFQIVAVPAVILLTFWFVLQLAWGIAALTTPSDVIGGVAFFAHVGGFVAGACVGMAIRVVESATGRGRARMG